MVLCPKCRKQVPDGTAHCGYCGAPLRSPEPAEKKTMFGYAAPVQASPGTSAPAPERPPAPAPAPVRATAARARIVRDTSPDDAMAKTQFGGDLQTADAVREKARVVPVTLMQQGMPAPASLRPSERHDVQPRPADIPPTHLGEDDRATAPHSGRASQPVVIAPAHGSAPGREPSRPILASESLAEDRAPLEPGRTAMRILMLIGGALLIAAFLMPVGTDLLGHHLLYSWQLLGKLSGASLLNQFYPAVGVLCVAAALLPVPFVARALVGALLGLAGVGLTMARIGGEWHLVATLSVCFLLPAALLHRWRYRSSLLARVLVAACVLAVLALLLVPTPSGVPLILIFTGLGGAGGAAVLARLWPILLLLLGLLSLLAFLGSGSTGLVQVWAVCLLFYAPLGGVLGLLSAPAWDLQTLQVIGANAALLVYLTLAAHGLSQVMAAASRPSR